MARRILSFIQEDSGQDLIEYTLVAALIALGCVFALKVLANGVGNTFTTIGTSLSNAVS